MKQFLSGPGGQIFALICISFGAGAGMMTALQLSLRGSGTWFMFAGLTALLCVVVSITAVRLRKTIQ
jgi:hypothetical protein